MTYVKKLREDCQKCSRRATWEVFNNRNASCGKYCGKCVVDRVMEMKRLENKSRVSTRKP